MAESFKSKMLRMTFNLFPCYRATGGRVTYVRSDYREIRVKLPLNRKTRNYVGTIFGGSMYGCVDPVYMLMLIRILGDDYIVWDKAATIRFKKPGRSTLYVRFYLEEDEIEAIKETLKHQKSVDRVYTVELRDAQGTVHATIEKTIYIARKSTAV